MAVVVVVVVVARRISHAYIPRLGGERVYTTGVATEAKRKWRRDCSLRNTRIYNKSARSLNPTARKVFVYTYIRINRPGSSTAGTGTDGTRFEVKFVRLGDAGLAPRNASNPCVILDHRRRHTANELSFSATVTPYSDARVRAFTLASHDVRLFAARIYRFRYFSFLFLTKL